MIKRLALACLALLVAAAPAASQGTVIPFVTQYFNDASGNPVSNGKLCSYAAGTSTPLATYSDVTLMTANANPTRTSANGRPTTGAIYLSPTSYKFELRTAGTDNTCSSGTVLWTLDNVSAVPTSSGNVDVTGTAGETLAAGDVVYLSDGSNSLTAGRFYKADADFIYASSGAGIIGIATAAIASGTSGSIRLVGQYAALSGLTAGSTYYVSATAGALTATAPANVRVVGQAISTTTIDFASNPRPILNQPLDVAEGRVTCTSGVPVTVIDCTAVATLYYTPYTGNRIALYDGTALWNERTFSEITISVAACTASKPYDIFLYDNAGTVTAEQLVWTDATTRATALTLQDGVLVKTGAKTRRFVATYYCNASGGHTDDSVIKRNVSNYYHRKRRSMRRVEATSWDYTTATWRQAHADAANQLEFTVGVSEDLVSADLRMLAKNDNSTITFGVGIGLDSTTAVAADSTNRLAQQGTVSVQQPTDATYAGYPGVGRHVLTWLEKSEATGTTNWSGIASGTVNGSHGLIGEIWN